MTLQEDTFLELASEQARIQKDIEDAQRLVKNCAQELEGAKVSLQRAQERAKAFSEALTYMKVSAEIVSIDEFHKVRTIVQDNMDLVSHFNGVVVSAKKRGTEAAATIKRLSSQLEEVEKEMNSYGKILRFPIPKQDVDEEDDYDSDP